MWDFIEVEKTTLILSIDPVALIAVLIAMSSLVVSILSIARDRPKVKITMKKGWTLVNPQPGYKEDVPYVGISVINAGIRPVTIASVGGKYLKDTGGFILADSMIGGSKELSQGKRLDCLMEESLYDDNARKYGVLRIEAEDLTGKVYVKNVAPFYKRLFFWPVRMVRTAMWHADQKSKRSHKSKKG